LKTRGSSAGAALLARWRWECTNIQNICLALTRSGQPCRRNRCGERASLMAWMQLKKRTIVINQISKGLRADDGARTKILACPVRQPFGTGNGRARSVQSAERRLNPQDLIVHQTRIAEVAGQRGSDQHHPISNRTPARRMHPPGTYMSARPRLLLAP